MEFLAALNLAIGVIGTFQKAAPVVNTVIKDFTPVVEALVSKWTGKELTEEQRTTLRQQIIDNHNRFQQPIPPEEDQ